MPEPIFMKLGMYIMAPEPISTVYFINPSHQSVCLFVYPRIAAGQRLGKNPPIVDRQRLGKKVTVGTNTHVSIEEFWTRRYTWGPCHIKESRRLILPRICCCLFVIFVEQLLLQHIIVHWIWDSHSGNYKKLYFLEYNLPYHCINWTINISNLVGVLFTSYSCHRLAFGYNKVAKVIQGKHNDVCKGLPLDFDVRGHASTRRNTSRTHL
jgi:hypothetical protein